ncbi:MAG TPA: hypothetical protein VMW25_04145 [Clostridia bacterium]|nr:hypothetical protein [Clostridia bacterium]
MARETISELKKKHQRQLGKIKKSIWLKCAECQGFFVDGYRPCPNQNCPLRSFYPPTRTVESLSFRETMLNFAKEKKNDEEFLAKILPAKKRPKK